MRNSYDILIEKNYFQIDQYTKEKTMGTSDLLIKEKQRKMIV